MFNYATVGGAYRKERQLWVDLPFIGEMNAFWRDGTHGRTFFESTQEGRSKDWWVGPLHVQFSSDSTKRPGLASFVMLVALAGWTEGHLWTLPGHIGASGAVLAFGACMVVAAWAYLRFGRDDSRLMC